MRPSANPRYNTTLAAGVAIATDYRGGIVPVWRSIGRRQPLVEDRGPDSLTGVGAGVQRAFFPFGSAEDELPAVPWFDPAEAPDGSE